jgi:hypothetical protein
MSDMRVTKIINIFEHADGVMRLSVTSFDQEGVHITRDVTATNADPDPIYDAISDELYGERA